jgi:ABC-type dipeptide/oligopeptide/nickel transport system permease subunit/Zn-dependent M28 family amino/carboxypeptidase
MAQKGQQGLPATLSGSMLSALDALGQYLFHHPASYIWHRELTPALDVVLELFVRSAGLLLVSLVVAAVLGILFGSLAALMRRNNTGPFMLLVSILGISTPSFLLAMLLWILNVRVYQWLETPRALLPPTGFGWDLHLIMPALVLAARPLAQIMQVTYVNMTEVIGQDFIRAAKARGVPGYLQVTRHALRNILIPIFTTIGTSLRFSLASLPVVETFFVWPGLGLTLLETLDAQMDTLIVDLIVALGIMFLLINFFLDVLYPLIDPRLRRDAQSRDAEDEMSWTSQLESIQDSLAVWWADLRNSFRRLLNLAPVRAAATAAVPGGAPPVPVGLAPTPGTSAVFPRLSTTANTDDEIPYASSGKRILHSALTNLPLLVGTAMVFAFIALAFLGNRIAAGNPFETHGIMMIDKIIQAPPFSPSDLFPWGTDAIGRDIQALVLWGARQTLAMAFFGMLARIVLGVVLGLLAGWSPGKWIDQVIHGVISIWSAFPITLFAMIMILALGIQKGMSVFIITLCLVGWGEIAQFVRGQVISQKPLLYIEAARSVGADPLRILVRHILPHLLPSILVFSALEMGGILMLLAELGFLNIFLGGGYRVEIADTGRSSVFYFFSDVPEWGALLANIRNWWRSYPWMAWYPGVFFFLAILAFNLLGEGMRRFLEESKLNLGRFMNRYTAMAALVALIGVGWMLRSSAPIEVYKPVADEYQVERALQDLQVLSSPEFAGRESGTDGALKAAEYIAQQMDEIGLFPAGNDETFFQEYLMGRAHLMATPRLELLDEIGVPVESFIYRQDFSEFIYDIPTVGEVSGHVMGLAVGAVPSSADQDRIRISSIEFEDNVFIVREQDLPRFYLGTAAGLLIIPEDKRSIELKYHYPSTGLNYRGPKYPRMYITAELAERLLQSSGSSLAQLDQISASLQMGQASTTAEGAHMLLHVPVNEVDITETHYNVIGYIPGEGAQVGLDSNVILISAYFDGLGTAPDGSFYPSANDNASGVATMLELARVLKETSYFPKKTIVFVAWSGGEYRQGLSLVNVMGAKTGFSKLNIEAVIELSGMGGGSGNGVALGQGSSYRLVSVFQDAAARLGISTTTRGRNPHFNIPIASAFGGREALTAYIAWDGSDELAHTTNDTFDNIDPEKLEQSGRLVTLVTSVLSRETEY